MKRYLRLTLLLLIVFALIIVPFLFFGEVIDAWVASYLEDASRNKGFAAVLLGGLLALDIILPTPSSIVSTACGLLFGFMGGTLVSLAGMTISCVLGYFLGRWARPVAGRMLGPKELEWLDGMNARWGRWVIVIARPVPVLAEASMLFAGMGRMNALTLFGLSFLANLGISAVYAAVGATAATVNSFILALVGAMTIPLAAIGLSRIAGLSWRGKSGS